MTAKMLLNPERAARLIEYQARDSAQPGLKKIINSIVNETLLKESPAGLSGEVKRSVDFIILDHLMNLASNDKSSSSVKSVTRLTIDELSSKIVRRNSKDFRSKAHQSALKQRLSDFKVDPKNFKMIEDDYDVAVSVKYISHFINRNKPVQYWIALEPDSSF